MGTWTWVAGLYIHFPNQVNQSHFLFKKYMNAYKLKVTTVVVSNITVENLQAVAQ
jgi:hypothetical protein